MERILPAGDGVWRSSTDLCTDAPNLICILLEAPLLVDLAVHDTTANGWDMRQMVAAYKTWNSDHTPARTPQLMMLTWKPAWSAHGINMLPTVDALAETLAKKLPGLDVAIAVDKSEHGYWRVYTRNSGTSDDRFGAKTVWAGIKEDWWRTASVKRLQVR